MDKFSTNSLLFNYLTNKIVISLVMILCVCFDSKPNFFCGSNPSFSPFYTFLGFYTVYKTNRRRSQEHFSRISFKFYLHFAGWIKLTFREKISTLTSLDEKHVHFVHFSCIYCVPIFSYIRNTFKTLFRSL